MIYERKLAEAVDSSFADLLPLADEADASPEGFERAKAAIDRMISEFKQQRKTLLAAVDKFYASN